MSGHRVGILMATIALSTACGRGPEPAETRTPPAPRLAETAALEQRNMVRVGEEMLRDLRVTTAAVEEHRGAEAASILGELTVNENAYAEVGSPLAGRIVQLHAALGQRVLTGAPLATLQSGELARARGDLATAEARVSLTTRTLARKRTLNEERIVPIREVQEAEQDAIAANETLRVATSNLQALGADASVDAASNLVIRAPVGGTVIDRAAVLGQVADPSRPLFKLAELSTLWLIVHAFERDAVRLRVGEAARITLAATPGQTYAGNVSFIGHTVESESRTVPVRIELKNPNEQLRPGMSATAWLPVGDEQGVMLTVPSSALQRVRDRWCVFIPKDVSSFEIRPVGRGRDLAGEVEIVSGLTAGETVVVDGAFLLKAESEKAAGEHEEH